MTRTYSLCPWCSAEARVPIGSDDSYHYVLCARHKSTLLAQHAETRHLTRIGRPIRRHALARGARAA